MRMVDDRGRLFGLVNLIDLGLLLLFLVLMPLAYGAYVLFRMPPPRVTAVTPNSVVLKKGVEQRVKIQGEFLRPFLKASLNKIEARAFLVETPHAGELVLLDVPPGTYDLVLFDESQEVVHMPNAITIALPPEPPVQIVGAFVGPTASSTQIVAGMKFGPADHPVAELLDVSAPAASGRPATLRAQCGAPEVGKPCLVAGVATEPGAELFLTAPGQDIPLTFRVGEVRIDSLWADLNVRFVGLPEVVSLVRVGDVDRHLEVPNVTGAAGIARGAVLTALGVVQDGQGSLSWATGQNVFSSAEFSVSTSAASSLPLQARTADVRLPVEPATIGWKYRDSMIRTGSVLTFETRDYSLRALILGVSKPALVSPPLSSAARSRP